MLKKIFASLLVTFFMASAMASSGKALIFSDLPFEEWRPELEKAGVLQNGRFPTALLAETVAAHIKHKGLSKLSEPEVAAKWLEYYRVPKASISGAEYDSVRGQLGYDEAFVASLNPAAAPAVKVAEKVAQAPQTPPAPAVTPVAANPDAVGQAIKAEREAVAKMPPSPEVVELRKRLDALAAAKANAVTKDDIAEVAKQVTNLRKELLGKIDAVDKKVEVLGGRIKVVEGDIKTLQDQINDPKTGLAEAHTKAEAAQTAANEAMSKYSDTDKRLKAVEQVTSTSLWSNIGLVVAIIIGLWALARTFRGQKSPVKSEKAKVATPESSPSAAAKPQRREPVRPSDSSNVTPLRTAKAGTDSTKASGFPNTEPANPIADDVGNAFEPPAWMRKGATTAPA